MPGVVVTTAVRTGPSGAGDITAGQLFIAGETERGSITDATLIRSFSEFTTEYGNYVAGNLWPHVKAYFEEGGSRCYVGRTVDATATAGTLAIDGPTVPVIDLDAKNPGAWSANVDVEVLAPDVTLAGAFRLRFWLDDVLLVTSRDLVDEADGVAWVNTSSVSHLVVATDLAATGGPVVAAKAPLSAGVEGTVVDSEVVTTLDALFDSDYGAGAVAAPGWTGSTVWEGLRDHAAGRNRIAMLGFGSADSAATVKTAASAYYADAEAKRMAFYFPFIKVTDPASSGLTINISPEAYAAAARTRAVQEAGGPWRAGAGIISAASGYVQGVVTSIDKAVGDLLDEARVNAIRTIGGSVRVYGARSVSNDEDNWRYITFQDTINDITAKAEVRLEEFVFSTIDSRGGLFGRIEASLVGLLDPMRIRGGLYEAFDINGERVDPGYSVAVTDENNPVSQLAQGRVNAEIGVRVSSVGDQISISITKSNLTASVV